jgi:hypothetical protein
MLSLKDNYWLSSVFASYAFFWCWVIWDSGDIDKLADNEINTWPWICNNITAVCSACCLRAVLRNVYKKWHDANNFPKLQYLCSVGRMVEWSANCLVWSGLVWSGLVWSLYVGRLLLLWNKCLVLPYTGCPKIKCLVLPCAECPKNKYVVIPYTGCPKIKCLFLPCTEIL